MREMLEFVLFFVSKKKLTTFVSYSKLSFFDRSSRSSRCLFVAFVSFVKILIFLGKKIAKKRMQTKANAEISIIRSSRLV